MNDDKTRQQIVEKITNSANILVTVSNDPSVDALSAALALTIMLNKLSKHTTAIFSGAIPPAITFLDPEKTFESSTDSLRDFIIALDKEKADHLRYKVDGDVVKIFITPYRTTISDKDLEFSQGDYNVELVLALGVENQAHLDSALEAHGSILHDATVVTISTGQSSSSLGSIDWRDETASSLSEMLVTLSDIIKGDTPLIDQQVATALLTGIVAETDRFSNTKTSSKVMTMAAQLMAAGADQQLIASKLQESHEIGAEALSNMNSSTVPPAQQTTAPVKEGLAIDHGDVTPPAATAAVAPAYSEPTEPTPESAAPAAADTTPATPGKIADAYALDPEQATESTPTTPAVAPLLGGVTITPPEPVVPLSPIPAPAGVATPEASPSQLQPPTEEISKHSYLDNAPSFDTSINSSSQAAEDGSSTDIFAGHGVTPEPTSTTSQTLADPVIPTTDPLASLPGATDLGSRDEASRNDALAAVGAAAGGTPQPFSPAPGVVLPPPPPLPDFGALPSAMSSAYALDPVPTATPAPAQPELLGDILATPPPSPPAQPASNDPGQFKIPGQ